ncbi:hypothetical protein KAFR_0B04900 [Kazachstania africana CBS 2517]|uniref:Uncharacterized protein n=1 Tax=Kazachstania africana (strain ATCC 22294 / BCRC 22015 / CBS 2517 / CECT 1963 / NBRC 1671 / NRRL Y-8276) TaxID=1071382 RepID=H2AQY6_KAZAF|nr:hypothetical protein KAFR_0B04900 [Kazachstania africana CBS 2517]CCF56786.1 hypothetical protein KAFR_0B04900 [Kazachstania africana CBS 2517]
MTTLDPVADSNGKNTWRRWWNSGEDNLQTAQNDANGWYSSMISKVPPFRPRNNLVSVDDNTRYSQLNSEQISSLETEARNAISNRNSSWCWYEDLTEVQSKINSSLGKGGVMSVFDTGSGRCPLPLPAYPIEMQAQYNIHINNSFLLPSASPNEIYHPLPLRTMIASAVKNYYNLPTEKHLYLRKEGNKLLKQKRVLILSLVGWLPEKYEKVTLGEQRSAYYLSQQLAKSLQDQEVSEISSLSFECPLESKELKTVFEECNTLLSNWKNLFYKVDSIFFIGVYHSVPLAVLLAREILQNHQSLGFDTNTYVGLLSIESCLQGYRFWDHSVDANNFNRVINPNADQDYTKAQEAKEKQLFQGLTKNEKEVLSKLKNYRDPDSVEAKLVRKDLDWILFNWDLFRMSLVGKLYDNFMTLSQKLAIDYCHPKIMRNLWCDGAYLDTDLKKPGEIGIPDFKMKTPSFDFQVKIPDDRNFEISLVDNFLLAQNLGYNDFIPLLTLVGPYFISRSFNPNTLPTTLKKQKTTDTKIWLQNIDPKWASKQAFAEKFQEELQDEISSVYNFLEYAQYQTVKNPELINIRSGIYDDDSIYGNFVDCTLRTKNLLIPKHLAMIHHQSDPTSILETINQYDLVWKFHEALSTFLQLRNLPIQDFPKYIHLSTSLHCSSLNITNKDPTRFERDDSETLNRLRQIWEAYQTWDPPTRGLKHLRNILSALSSYRSFSRLLHDVDRR